MSLARVPSLLLTALSLSGLGSSLFSQQPAADEMERCKANLGLIKEAIQAYRAAQKDLPPTLGELVPRFLANPDILMCPASRRRGLTSADVTGLTGAGFGDPKTSYFYEFGLQRVPPAIAGGSSRSMREWKRRQLGMVGSGVPIVSCHLHPRRVYLPFEGDVFDTPGDWENRYASVIRIDDLSPGALFRSEMIFEIVTVPPRDPRAGPKLLDLSDYYNAAAKKPSRRGDLANDLGTLLPGIQNLAGMDFEIRGLVQLAARNAFANKYPSEIKGIKVGQACQAIHFLHGAAYSASPGTEVAKYRMHFANRQTRELPLIYGKHLLDWWDDSGFRGGQETEVAWKGANDATRSQGKSIRLFKTRWANPWPGEKIESIDFVSALSYSSPFLIAITLE